MITFIIIWWLILGLLAARVIWVSEEFEIDSPYNYFGIFVFCFILALMGGIAVYITMDSIPDEKYKFW